VIAIAAFHMKATALGHRLQQRGLPTPVLAHEKGDRGGEFQIDATSKRRNVERVERVGLREALRLEA